MQVGVIRPPKPKLISEQKLRIYSSPRHIANAMLGVRYFTIDTISSNFSFNSSL